MRDAHEEDGAEATTIDIAEPVAEPDDDAESRPRLRPKRPSSLFGPDEPAEPECRQLLTKLVRVTRRVREIRAADPGASVGPASDGEWFAAIPGLLLAERLWLDQAVTSHDKHGDLSIVTIDFRWIDVDTGQTLGPRTFIGYGTDDGVGGVDKALAATVRTFLRHTFLIGSGDANDGSARTPGVLPGPRRGPSRRPAN